MAKTMVSIDDLKLRIARRLSDNRIPQGAGELGLLNIALARRVTRTFRAHWTGFKLFYPERTIVLHAALSDGRFWSEGYISPARPSWVLSFRRDVPSARGNDLRPDDKNAPPKSIEVALAQRQSLVDQGIIPQEELIRMEDFDDPIEAVDQFFNYTALYVLKAVNADWSQLGYHPDPSIDWNVEELISASVPIDAAIEEGLKRSDILWLAPNTSPNHPIPCWFLFTREGRLFVISGERQQVIPNALHVRDAKVVTRWKGRDARMIDFEAQVRPLTARDDPVEFDEIASQLLTKRQSVRDPEETLERWKREATILELIPRG